MALSYASGDERPSWQATVTVNGVAEDMSSGYTFGVTLTNVGTGTVVLTKTTGITGATGGVVTVAWATNELAVAQGSYLAQLVATRTSDSAQWTVDEKVTIRTRN